MRRISIILCTALLALIAGCSDGKQTALGNYAVRQNRECPQVIDSELVLSQYSYDTDANLFTINYTCTEQANTVRDMRMSETPLRRIIAQNLQGKQLEELSGLLTEAGAAMRLRFIGKITDDTLDIDFSQEQLREIAAHKNSTVSDTERIEALMANENARCPQKVDGDRLIISSVTVDSAFVEVAYVFDPAVYNFRDIDSLSLVDQFRPLLQESLQSAQGAEQLALMKALNLGMRYRFEANDSAAPFCIYFLPQEIAEY